MVEQLFFGTYLKTIIIKVIWDFKEKINLRILNRNIS